MNYYTENQVMAAKHPAVQEASGSQLMKLVENLNTDTAK